MANSLDGLYQTIYAALAVVSRELVGFIPAVSKDSRADMAAVDQPIRSPVVGAMTAMDIVPGNVKETGASRNVGYVDLTITKQRKVDFHLTGEQEKGLMVGGAHVSTAQQSFMQAFRTLGNEIEGDLAALAVNTSRAYGTAGTTPFGTKDDLSDASQVMKILDDNGAPRTGRSLILNTAAVAHVLGKQPAAFRVNEAGGEMERRFGQLQAMFGFGFGTSGQLALHAVGAGTGHDTTQAYSAGSTSIAFDGASGGGLNAGDIITFAGHADKYVVQEAVPAGATGTIKLAAPGLRAAITNDTAITKQTAGYTPNVAFSMDAFHLACRVPAVPEDGDGANDRTYVMDPHTGLVFEISIYRQYRQVTYEVAICWGVVAANPQHAGILLG